MIYIVSGFMRSGTSMMMQSLESGGMKIAKSNVRDKKNDESSDEFYKPNANGMYELTLRELSQKGFPRQYNNQGLKIVIPWLKYMSVQRRLRYKVVFMLRNYEEIRQSCEASFNMKFTVKHIHEEVKKALGIFDNRKDIESIDVFQYRKLVRKPLKYLRRLQDNGWPIGIEAAANAIQPLTRFKIEHLTIGI